MQTIAQIFLEKVIPLADGAITNNKDVNHIYTLTIIVVIIKTSK